MNAVVDEFAEELGTIMHVHVTNPQDIKPEKEAKCLIVINTFTEVITGINDQQGTPHILLTEDTEREYAIVTALDNPVVLCHTAAQAGDTNNTTATLLTPSGAVIPINQPIPVTGNNKIWVTAGVFPSRVSVIVGRRGY